MLKYSLIPAGRRLLLAALIGTSSATFAAAQQPQQPIPSVTVETVKPTDFTLTVKLPGRIKASTVAEVRPQVSGIIRERLFKEGSHVQQGQPLYKIDDATYVAAVNSAKAAVAQAQASYDFAVIDARRALELFNSNTGTASSRDTKAAEQTKAEAALSVAKAQLTTAEIDLERTTIRAPISGIIGFSDTTVGGLVSALQATALTTIRELDTVNVDVTQSVSDLLRWKEQREIGADNESGVASMMLPNGETYPLKGDLKAAEPRVEPTTGMVTLRIAFANPKNLLLPGLYVEVELPQAVVKNAVLVPQDAVMRNPDGSAFVWVVDSGKIAVRPVNIVTNSGDQWVVGSGLKAGDELVTSGFQKAGPGAPVQIAKDPAPGAPAPNGSK